MIDQILELFTAHHLRILDVVGAVLGLVYILLEYRASIYLWLVSIIMPLVDMWLYFSAGLYADFGMAIYSAGRPFMPPSHSCWCGWRCMRFSLVSPIAPSP